MATSADRILLALIVCSLDLLGAPPSQSRLENVKWTSEANVTRIEVALTASARFRVGRLNNPPRIYVDLLDTVIDAALKVREFPVDDALLSQIRIGTGNSSARVVMEVEPRPKESVRILSYPWRLTIDLMPAYKPLVLPKPERSSVTPVPQIPSEIPSATLQLPAPRPPFPVPSVALPPPPAVT